LGFPHDWTVIYILIWGGAHILLHSLCKARLESDQALPMLIDATTLVALVSSKICHDLVSPIAALTTALDILEDDHGADMREQAMELIRTSANQAAVKLEFMRTAFGAGTVGAGSFELGEVQDLAQRFFETQKPELNWNVTLSTVPRPAARLLMHLMLVGLDCLPRGGQLDVNGSEDNDRISLSIVATGPRAGLKPSVRAGLAGEMPEGGFDGRSIQPYVTYLTGAGCRAELAARESEERVEIIVRMNAG
jgi:histidine phosphotransferase ChpT